MENPLFAKIKFMSGEVLGWAGKEFAVLAAAAFAAGLSDNAAETEVLDRLRKLSQGTPKANALRNSASGHLIYFGVCLAIVLYAFTVVLPYFRRIVSCLIRAPWPLGLPRARATATGELTKDVDHEAPISTAVFTDLFRVRGNGSLSNEEVDDLSAELLAELLKTQTGYSIVTAVHKYMRSGMDVGVGMGAVHVLLVVGPVCISGILFSGVSCKPKDDGDREKSAAKDVVLAEPKATHNSREVGCHTDELSDFFGDLCGMICGLSLGLFSKFTKRGLAAASADFSDLVKGLIGVLVTTGLALSYFIFLDVRRLLFVICSFGTGCGDKLEREGSVSHKIGKSINHFSVVAVTVAGASAWEDWFGDVCCSLSSVSTIGALPPTAVQWLYVLLVWLIFIPLSLLMTETRCDLHCTLRKIAAAGGKHRHKHGTSTTKDEVKV